MSDCVISLVSIYLFRRQLIQFMASLIGIEGYRLTTSAEDR